VATDVPLIIVETIGDLRVSIAANLHDLSVTGLRATQLPKPLGVGRTVDLEFELPGQRRLISAQGRVVRATDDLAGIEFLDLSPQNRQLLQTFFPRRA
jgi:hypothetical protein